MEVKYAVYAGIAIGVVAMAGVMVFATTNQQNNISDNVVSAPAALEGSIPSETGLGPTLNKEKWHEDPFGDIAAKVRANAGV